MSKSNKIVSKINEILKNEIKIDIESVLDKGESYDNLSKLENAVSILLDQIERNSVDNIEINEEYNRKTVVQDISGLFVIGLINIEPSDYEGDEPLVVEEMIETSSLYIFNQIQKQEIKGLNFFI